MKKLTDIVSVPGKPEITQEALRLQVESMHKEGKKYAEIKLFLHDTYGVDVTEALLSWYVRNPVAELRKRTVEAVPESKQIKTRVNIRKPLKSITPTSQDIKNEG